MFFYKYIIYPKYSQYKVKKKLKMEIQSCYVILILSVILALIFCFYICCKKDEPECNCRVCQKQIKQRSKILFFHSPNCGHCKNMMSEWNKFEKRQSRKYVTKKINIDLPENADMSDNYEVRGVPHIVKIAHGRKLEVYSGDRTATAFKSWARQ